MAHLEQLPDHHHFQDRADSSRRDDEGVGGEHELVQARKERPMLERLGHKSIDILFKRQINSDPDGLGAFRRGGGAFIGSLHQPWAAQLVVRSPSRPARRPPAWSLRNRTFHLRPCRTEDRNSVAVAPGWFEPREIVDHIHRPRTEFARTCFHSLLVGQADRIRSTFESFMIRCLLLFTTTCGSNRSKSSSSSSHLSSPAVAGEDEGGGLNDWNRLNGLNAG